jgi:predicted signal transduction protein with EAL and GGDEF domain
VVARFGGDEFSILLTDLSDPDVAIRVAERIVESLRDPVMAGEHELFVSTSIGIAISPGGQVLAGDLLSQSDLAMYVAKDNGRGRWELFDPASAPSMMERLELESDLWRAIDTGELVVQFQPELDLRCRRVVATEALIRWQHPTRGLISPDRFVPFAEESGLIVAIDRLVLREACRWAREWSCLAGVGDETQPIVVSVNLSPRSLSQDDVVHDIMRALDETGVDARCIQIELTERSALTDLEVTSMKLRRLRALGVRIAIDDFGTGYSSLSYLKRLPIDVLKLDKSLLDSIDTVSSDVAIVQAAITMGHALGMKITAEGVERVAQADRLRELGCDTACGWLWSPAVSPEKLGEYAVSGLAAAGTVRADEVVSATTAV